MRKLLATIAAVFLIGAHQAWALSGRVDAGGGTPIPIGASSVGYTIHTFSTKSFTTANVDKSLTYGAGFQWYLSNFFGQQVPSNAVTLNSDGTISALYTGNIGLVASTVGQISGSPFYVGTAFGCGAYVTAEISFNPSQVAGVPVGWPAWWSMAVEHLVGLSSQQWTGQPSNYDHFIELDTFEYLFNPSAVPHAYAATMHDWYGISSVTCSSGYCGVSTAATNVATVPKDVNWQIFHRVAFQWVPATVSVNGSVQYYFDDIPVGTPVSWSQFTNQSPPPTGSTPWTYGVIDQQHLGLIFGSASGAINVKSVDVWQNSSACNLTNSPAGSSQSLPLGFPL